MIVKEIESNLTNKQFEAIEILNNQETDFFLFGGGAGGGKSWLGCEWLISMCISYPETRWFIGRKQLKKLKETTLVTFFKVCKKYGLKKDQHYTYQAHNGLIRFYNDSEILMLDLESKPSDPMFEDLGSYEFTGGMIEEAGEVSFNAFDTLKSRIGRHMNDHYGIRKKMLITCNPKKNWLYTTFFKPWKSGELASNYKFIQSLVTDNDKIDKDYINSLIEIKDKTKKERLLKGNWEYDDDPSQLVDFDSITDIFTNAFVPAGDSYITADIARFGSDRTVIFRWSGFRVEEVIILKKASTTESKDFIKSLMNKYNIPASKVMVDEDGVGGGVVDNLQCKGFVNNSSALEIELLDSKGNKQTIKENYDNLKSQCGFKLADALNGKQLYFNADDKTLQVQLTEELEVLRQKDMDSDGPMKLITRKEMIALIGRSPDLLVTLIMRMWFEIAPKPTKPSTPKMTIHKPYKSYGR